MTRRKAVALASVAIAAALAVSAALATAARAHSEIESSDPSDGASVPVAPERLSLLFAAPVSIGTVEIEGPGDSAQPAPEVVFESPVFVAVVPAQALPEGGYTVTFRMTATDGHAIDGSIRFGIRARAPAPAPGSGTPTRFRPPLVLVATRSLDLAAGLLLLGASLLRTRLAPNQPAARRALVALSLVWAAAACASLAALVLTTPGLTSSSALLLVTDTRVGRLSLVRAAIAVVVAALLIAESAEERFRLEPALVAAIGCATFPLGGHATSARGGVLGAALAVVHVVAAGVWAGGLALLVARGRSSLRQALPLFSDVAAFSIGAVLLSGALASALRLGGLTALWTSDYGRVLLGKLLVVTAALAVGAYLRLSVIPATRSRASAASQRPLRFEAALAGAVIVLSALLATLPPPVLR